MFPFGPSIPEPNFINKKFKRIWGMLRIWGKIKTLISIFSQNILLCVHPLIVSTNNRIKKLGFAWYIQPASLYLEIRERTLTLI